MTAPPPDRVARFIEAASVPRSAHGSGTLEDADAILQQHPEVARHSIHTAALLGDDETVRRFLDADPASARAKGGAFDWDPLSYLCFSRYLRLDVTRSDAFVRTARALLDAGASARTGWTEMIDQPNPRPVFESALYGAAAIAGHPQLTRLLLERGADPNDEETPYHVPETYDNTVMTILLESRRLDEVSLSTMLLRKADWHDLRGLQLLLEHGADPKAMTRFGYNALHQAIRRDNSLEIVAALLDHGADPSLPNTIDGRSAAAMAARRGRGDVLALLRERGLAAECHGVERLIAACATDDGGTIERLTADEPSLVAALVDQGGTLLAEFSGAGNLSGVRRLLECGVRPTALYAQGDPYFGIAKHCTALHVAAWRGWPRVVEELIARGTPVDARDGLNRTALALAIKACVDSYWTDRRSPDSVRSLLNAGASTDGVVLPTGYDEVDDILKSEV